MSREQGNGGDDMTAQAEIRRAGQGETGGPPLVPGDQGKEDVGRTLVEVRFANLHRPKEVQELTNIYRDPSVVEHVGPLRPQLDHVDYTPDDIRQFFRANPNFHPLVGL